MSDTTYSIRVKYGTDVRAAVGGIGQVGAVADRSGRSVMGLKSQLLGLGAAVGGIAGVGLAKRSFIDFNASIEQSTISLAAQAQLIKGGTWAGSMREATGLFAFYQQTAKQSVGTTQDFLEMHQGIAASAMRAGVGMKQLKEMTVGATVAAQVLGERADMVALDVKQMLGGTINAKDRTAQILLASQGISQDKFNAMNQAGRNAVILKALNDPALKNAARALEGSFAGVTSTLKDNLQIAAGKVGLPLFKAITAEVQKWNAWIEKHPEQIAAFGKRFADALVTGMKAVKDGVKFLIDHLDTLKVIAEFAIAGKGIALLGGAAGGMKGLLGGVAGLGPAADGASRGLVGVTGALASFGMGLAVLRLAAEAGATALNKYQDRVLADEASLATIARLTSTKQGEGDLSTDQFLKDLGSGRMFKDAGQGLLGRGNNLGDIIGAQVTRNATSGMDRQTAIQALAAGKDFGGLRRTNSGGFALDEDQLRRSILAKKGGTEAMADAFTEVLKIAMTKVDASQLGAIVGASPMVKALFAGGAGTLAGIGGFVSDLQAKKKVKQNVNVQVSIKEVRSDDPDRFVRGLSKIALRAIKNPTQARRALREG